MKKQMIFMMAGGLLAFASCNESATTGPSEAQIDSMVNARVQIMEMELMAKNDSIINAMATMKADSMILAMKSGGSNTSSSKTTRPAVKPSTPPPVVTPPVDPSKTRNNQNTVEDQKKRNNQSGEKAVEDQKKRNNQ